MEVQAEVIESMDIKSVQLFRDSLDPEEEKDKGARLLCEERMSISKHLCRYIGDGEALVKILYDHLGYVSGSVSLDYFVRGSTGENTDLDIFLPDDAPIVASFLQQMRSIGYKFYSAIEKYERCGTAAVPRAIFNYRQMLELQDSRYKDELSSITTHSLSRCGADGPKGMQNLPLRSFPASEPRLLLEMIEGQKVARTPGVATYDIGNIRDIIQGSIKFRGKDVPVQVMVEPRAYSFSCPSIASFHSTHVQSFLAPGVACHLYASSSIEKEFMQWRKNCNRHAPLLYAEAIRQKWNARDYREVERLQHFPDIETESGEERFKPYLVLQSFPEGSSAEAKEFYLSSYHALKWKEDRGSIEFADVPTLPRHSEGRPMPWVKRASPQQQREELCHLCTLLPEGPSG